MSLVKKRAEMIDNKILEYLKKQIRPVSTLDISNNLKMSWHTIINHCLKLQIAGRIEGYKIANLNVWSFKR